MTTCIYVENVLGSGHVVTLIEDFGDHTVRRDLQPGENARLIVSPFKTICVQELLTARAGLTAGISASDALTLRC
jgi:hypothetical protein